MYRSNLTAVILNLENNTVVRPSAFLDVLKRRYNIKVTGFTRGNIYEPYKNKFQYDPIIINRFLFPLPFMPFTARQIIKKIKDTDVVYVADYNIPHFLPSLTHAKTHGKTIILDIVDFVSVAGLTHPKYLLFHSHIIYYKLMEKLVRYVDILTVPTEYLREKFGGTVFYTPVDTDIFNPEVVDGRLFRRKIGIGDDEIVVMFTGMISRYKGVEDLIRAVKKAIKTNKDLKLVVVGGSPDKRLEVELRTLAGEETIFVDFISHERMPEILAAADIFAVPQRISPTTIAQIPAKIFEGMAMGKAILSTKVSDIPKVLENTGYIVEPGNIDQLAEKIIMLANDEKLRKTKGLKARKKCIQKYNYDVAEKRLLKMINDL